MVKYERYLMNMDEMRGDERIEFSGIWRKPITV